VVTTPTPPPAARLLDWTAIAFLFLATSYQILCAAQAIVFLNEHVLRMDDAYYYFEVARNIADHDRVTFDGIHTTSGLQLLWGGVLTLLAEIVHDRVGFLRAILVISAVLNLGTGLMLRRLGRRLDSPVVGHVATVIWSAFMLGISPTMIGMEYALHALVIVATVACLWSIWSEPEAATTGRLLGLGGLLTLNFWTRLDSASLSLMAAAATGVVLWPVRAGWREWAHRMAMLVAVPAAASIAYVAVCYLAARTPIPISGLVKAHYAARHFDEHGWLTSLAGHVSWWFRVELRPLVDAASTALLAGHQPLARAMPLLVVAVSLLVTVRTARQIVRERRARPLRYRILLFLAFLWAIEGVHVAVVVTTIGHFSHVTQHYYGWLFLTWCLWAGLMFDRWVGDGSAGGLPKALATGALTAVIIGNGAVAAGRFTTPVEPEGSLHNRRVPVIAWLDANLPDGSRIGAWNAGQIGYLSRHTVVNLDGLANDGDYLEVLTSGSSVIDYMRREGIDFLVDINAADLTMPYRASWDRERFFHRTVPRSVLEPVYVEPSQDEPIEVLRLRR